MIELDRRLFLMLNGSESQYWDSFMWTVTHTYPWILLAVVLFVILLRTHKIGQVLLILALMGFIVFFADFIGASFIKPLFHRLRPTHDPGMEALVDTVRGYRGGMYSFFSCHAANTFGLATFVSLLVRRRAISFTFYSWALLCSYSRIYLGVHYPGDILFGALYGILLALVAYFIYLRVLESMGERGNTYSEAYTRGGFLYSDTNILICTYFFILVAVLFSSLLAAPAF